MELPTHVQIEIATACNLGCAICPRTIALRHANTQQAQQVWSRLFPYEKFEKLLNSFGRLTSVTLHGIGEPLLHPKLPAFISKATAIGANVRLTTNGSLLSERRAEALAAAGLGRLVVSLDGITAETHEWARPGASYEQIVSNIRNAIRLWSRRRRRPRLEIAMVVSRMNEHEAISMPAYAKDLGADGVLFSPMKPATPALEELVTSSETWDKLRTALESRAHRIDIPIFIRGEPSMNDIPPSPGTHHCRQPWYSTVVLIDGNVMACCNIHAARFALGNAFEEDIKQVWIGTKYQDFREELACEDHVPAACRWCPEYR